MMFKNFTILSFKPELLFVLGIFSIVLFIFPKTLQLTYDSHDYISAGKDVETYLIGRNQDGVPYLHRPPLLPAFLHFFTDKIAAAWWLNILNYAISLLLCAQLAKHLNLQGFIFYLSVAVIAFSFPFIQNHLFLWTEPLFATFIILLAYLLLFNGSSFSIIVVCILSILLRKAGLFLVVGVALYYVFNRDFKKTVILVLSTATAFLAWEGVIYVHQQTSSVGILVAHQEYSRIHYVDVLTSWCVPRNIPLIIRMISIAIVFITVLYLYRNSFFSLIKSSSYHVIIVLPLVYLISFIVLFGMPDYHEAERYLSVVMPLSMLALFSFVNEVSKSQLPYRKVFVIGICVWCLYPLIRTFYHFYH